MDSKTLVDKYEAKLIGQQLLWEDCDLILRNTNFKPINPKFDKEALIHWWMHVYIPDGNRDEHTPYEVYHTWSNAMWQYFKYIHISGYNPETNQSAVKIACIQHKPLEPQVAELKMWIPHIKEANAAKKVSIFESTLSEFGSFGLEVINDNCIITRRGHKLEEFNNLDQAVAYIHYNLWYE